MWYMHFKTWNMSGKFKNLVLKTKLEIVFTFTSLSKLLNSALSVPHINYLCDSSVEAQVNPSAKSYLSYWLGAMVTLQSDSG